MRESMCVCPMGMCVCIHIPGVCAQMYVHVHAIVWCTHMSAVCRFMYRFTHLFQTYLLSTYYMLGIEFSSGGLGVKETILVHPLVGFTVQKSKREDRHNTDNINKVSRMLCECR